MDTKISLGNVLTILSMLGSLAFVYGSLSASLSSLEQKDITIEAKLNRYDIDHDALINLEAEVRTLLSKEHMPPLTNP